MSDALAYTRYELLRTLRNRRFFFFSLGFPLVLYFLIAGPNRHEHDFGGTGHLGAAVLHGRARLVRHDERDALLRRAHRGRARGRLEPPAAHQPALAARLLPREGAHRLRDGAAQHGRALRRRGLARRQPVGAATGWR